MGIKARVAAAALVLSAAGTSFIIQKEDLRQRAYLDSVGIPTVCVGHTATVRWNYLYSREECMQLLRVDSASAQAAVRKAIKVPLFQSEFDALVSFCFNVGNYNCTSSTMFKLINLQRYADAAKEFYRWKFANKLDCSVRSNNCYGVWLRRDAEYHLFVSEHP